MFDIKKFKETVDLNKALDPNMDYECDRHFSILIDIYTNNIAESIEYVLGDPDPYDLEWSAQVWDDVIAKTQSRELLDAFHIAANKIKSDPKYDDIDFNVDLFFADQALDEDYSFDLGEGNINI